MPFETLDCYLKRCVTWFQATPLPTSLHHFVRYQSILLFYVNHLIALLSILSYYVLYSNYAHNLPYASNTAPRTLRSNSWQYQFLAVCIPDTTWISLRGLRPYTVQFRRAYELRSVTQPVAETEPSTCLVRMGWPASTCSIRPCYTPSPDPFLPSPLANLLYGYAVWQSVGHFKSEYHIH